MHYVTSFTPIPLRAAAAAAKGIVVRMAIEPINPYEAYLTKAAEQALAFVRTVDHAKVAVMLDTFHANIEDFDVANVTRAAGSLLGYVHVADSNRQDVSREHIDFQRLIRALFEIGYDGALVMESLPPLASVYEAVEGRRVMTMIEQFVRESLA